MKKTRYAKTKRQFGQSENDGYLEIADVLAVRFSVFLVHVKLKHVLLCIIDQISRRNIPKFINLQRLVCAYHYMVCMRCNAAISFQVFCVCFFLKSSCTTFQLTVFEECKEHFGISTYLKSTHCSRVANHSIPMNCDHELQFWSSLMRTPHRLHTHTHTHVSKSLSLERLSSSALPKYYAIFISSHAHLSIFFAQHFYDGKHHYWWSWWYISV